MSHNKSKVKLEREGNLSYKRSLVNQIVELAAKEIAGVASFSDSKVLRMKKMFNKNFKRGIVLNFAEDGVYIDLYINILFGHAVNDVAYRVQENIKKSVESMTEFKVKKTNVHIYGINFDMENLIA